MEYEIVHKPSLFRFETVIKGYPGCLQYILSNDSFDIVSTFVPSPISGSGVAAALVKAACEYAQSRGLKIITTCYYAKVWLDRHPEYK